MPGEKREVMRMEQMWLFLSENSGWMFLPVVFSLIFPVIALHKIKGIERQLSEISGDVVEITAIMIHVAEAMPGKEDIYAKMSATAGQAAEKKAADGVEQQDGQEPPEELISAVLGEVFP